MTIDERRKMLVFRSWHRGTREMDLLMGSFADSHVLGFDARQLDEYEQLLTCQDPDLYDWKCGRGTMDEAENSSVMKLFLAHGLVA